MSASLSAALADLKSAPSAEARRAAVSGLSAAVGGDAAAGADLARELRRLVADDADLVEALSRAAADESKANASARMTLFGLAAKIAAESKEQLEWIVEKTPLLDLLLKEADNAGDPLSALAALEVASDVGATAWGLDWLEERGVLAAMDRQLGSVGEGNAAGLLRDAYIKFLGKLGRTYAKERGYFDAYPGLRKQLYVMLEFPQASGTEDAVLATSTVVHLSGNPRFKAALLGDNNPEFLDRFWTCLNWLIAGADATRPQALDDLAKLITPSGPDEARTNRDLFLRFKTPTKSGTALLAEYARVPFGDVAVKAYQVLKVLADDKWGLEAISKEPGLLEFLLNRNVDNESLHEVMNLKFDIVSAAAASPHCADVFGVDNALKLAEYKDQGVFYRAKQQAQVASKNE